VRAEPLVNKSVAVPPFADNRKNENTNLIGLMYIPLMPYGWMNLNTPEGGQRHISSGLWLFRPPEDLAKAVAEEINNSGIFREAFFTNRASEGELILKGNLISTFYNGNLISYCLSIYGADLWLIGLPAGSYSNNLEISFELVERETGRVLWNGTYKRNFSKTFWIYAPGADFRYDELLKEIMKEAIQSLRNRFANTSTQDTRPQPGKKASTQNTLPLGTTQILTWDFSVAKAGPGNNYPNIATFKKGDKLTILEKSGKWVKVRSENGQVGWVRSEVLE
jgi:hypothetical protein